MAALHCYVQPLLLSELWRWWEFRIGGMPGQKKKSICCSVLLAAGPMTTGCSRPPLACCLFVCFRLGDNKRASDRSGKKQIRIIFKLEEFKENSLCKTYW